MELDLDNLTQEDFMEMAKYVHQLQTELESVKANALAILAQRDNATRELQRIKDMAIQLSLKQQPKPVKINEDLNLVNPEQYREKKQF
jgi:hypothetical protein